MRSVRVLRTIRRAEYAELIALFFLQGAALGMWFVPLSTVLDAHGLRAIKAGWIPWLVLAVIQLHALCASPMFRLASTIVFARLADAKQEFGPLRAMATLGWMAGCLLVSALGAD